MKKSMLLMLVVIMIAALMLSACASPKQQPEVEEAAVEPEAVEEVAEEEEALSGELVVATWAGDPFQSAWQDMFTKFEEETGVKIIMDPIPWENLREKSALELASGSGEYDVLYVHPFWFREFVDNDYLVPVKDVVPQEVVDGYVEGLLDLYTVDGVLYGLPDFITTQTLAYRKDLFDAEGIPEPKSWDDVLNAAEMLSDGDNVYGISFPAKKTGALGSVYSALLVSNGGWYYDADGNPNINTQEAIEAADFIGELGKYTPPGVLNFHWDENATAAASGKVAMTLCMTVNSAWLEDPERSATVGKWAYAPITSNKGTPGGIVDSYCWSVAKGTENEKAAAKLIEFISGTEAQVYFTGKSGTCGATKAYYENEDLLESTPVLQAMNKTFANTMPNPSWKTWSAQQETLQTLLQDIIGGKTTGAEAMAALQAQMEAE